MTVVIAPDLGAWLVLRRVRWDGVTLDPTMGVLNDHGTRLPDYLTPHVHQLAERGYLRLSHPLPEMPPCRRVHLTDRGARLLALLGELSQTWNAAHRAGLPRCRADLDTLDRMLNEP